MQKFLKKGMAMVAVFAMVFAGCGQQGRQEQENAGTIATENTDTTAVRGSKVFPEATVIALSDEMITVDGSEISTNEESAVYVANDIVFYLEGQDFTYGEGSKEDEHPQEEADAHTVVHITEPGNYVISGKLSAGQIAVDLGKDAKKDEEAVVTLILNGVDITCSVAPGVIFYNVYECGDDDAENAAKDVDTSAAGANVIIADNSVNHVNGSYVARIYESVELNEAGTEVIDSKKLHKYDAAFYSKRSMNISGEEEGSGVLNIQAKNEGLDSELHLTINGGIININSGNDGINTNEDGVSVTTVNGGILTIVVNGSTGEGDGIDSNGWLVINGGIVTSAACGFSMDAGIDSDMGIHINGGTVIASGNMLDEIAGSEQNYAVFTVTEPIKGGSEIRLMKEDKDNVAGSIIENDCTNLLISSPDLEEGTYTLWNGNEKLAVSEISGGMFGMPGGGMFKPGNGKPGGEMPEFPDGEMPQMPEGGMPEFPEGNMPQRPEGNMPPEFGEFEFPGGSMGNADATEEFTIKEGANMFFIAK